MLSLVSESKRLKGVINAYLPQELALKGRCSGRWGRRGGCVLVLVVMYDT